MVQSFNPPFVLPYYSKPAKTYIPRVWKYPHVAIN